MGDSLGGSYSDSEGVYIDHMHRFTHNKEEFARVRGCHCPENANKLTKRDFVWVDQWNVFGYEQRPPWRTRELAKAEPKINVTKGGKKG